MIVSHYSALLKPHLGTACGYRFPSIQDIDKPEWILWRQQKLMGLEHLQVIYILIIKQKQTDTLLKNKTLHNQVFISYSHCRILASTSFRSTNKAVSCHPDSKIKKNLEDEVIQVYYRFTNKSTQLLLRRWIKVWLSRPLFGHKILGLDFRLIETKSFTPKYKSWSSHFIKSPAADMELFSKWQSIECVCGMAFIAK